MTRADLYNALNSVIPAFWIGQHSGECLAAYAVIKLQAQSKSITNGVAGWQVVDIMVYVPNTSVAAMDGLLDSINGAMQRLGLEATGNRTPDYLDTEVKAYMRSEQYRIPKQIV